MRVLWFLLVLALSVVAAEWARGGELVGRVGADGTWHYHDSGWDGAWIPTRCCGKSECWKANQGDGFQAQRLEDGSGYIVRIPGAGTDAGRAFFLAYDDPLVGPAEDGNYWVCTRWDAATTTRVPRCLFTPALGF